MIKHIILFLIIPLSIHSLESSSKRLAVFCHGFNNHAERFANRHKNYAPEHDKSVRITFKHRQVCFGVIGKNTIKEALVEKEDQPTSFVSFSQGTTATLHYLGSKKDCSNITSIVLIAPIADPRDIIQNYSFMKYLYVPKWISTRLLERSLKHYDPRPGTPIEQIDKIIKTLPKDHPVIISHGTNDTTSPWEQGYKIAKAFYEQGHKAVYFIEHDGGHNQPYAAELLQRCKEEVAKLSPDLSKEDFKKEQRAIQDRLSDPERIEIAKKIAAIYEKHGIAYDKKAFSSTEVAENYLFKNQEQHLLTKYQARQSFLNIARVAASTALIGAFGFAAYFIKKRFF